MNKVVVYLIIIVAFFLLASLWGFYISVKPPRIISHITPADYKLEYEAVHFKTDDSLSLAGWFIPHENNPEAKTIILLHGYPADKGNILPIARFLHLDFNLFLFDFRYFGESEGKFTTAGALEKRDLIAALRYLKTRGIDEVGVWGFSMGAAVALMTASEAPEIKAIISESSYGQLQWMAYELYRLPLLRYPFGWLTGLWGKLIVGMDISEVAPSKSVEKLKIPILIIHSKEDQVIPFQNAQAIQEGLKHNPRAEFWFQEELIHGQLAADYQKRILNFFERNL